MSASVTRLVAWGIVISEIVWRSDFQQSKQSILSEMSLQKDSITKAIVPQSIVPQNLEVKSLPHFNLKIWIFYITVTIQTHHNKV